MMLQELLDKKRRYLDHFFDHVDVSDAEKVLSVLNACKGCLYFTGVGKSGLIAKKIAVTMTSIGIKASYLSPTNALHGDIGTVSSQDVCMLMSKSGESEELLNLIPFLRSRGAYLIAVVSTATSRLSRSCHLAMQLPLEKELCPFDKVPTTSSVIQMIFGDILAIALMQKREVKLEHYAQNHPAGSIGKRMTIKVQDLMCKGADIPLCRPQDTLSEVLYVLSSKKCGCILITDDSILLGIFTDGDLRRALQKYHGKIFDMPMEKLMTKSPRCVSDNMLAWDALKIMEEDPHHPISALPIIDTKHRVQGILRMHDIIQSGL